MVDGFETLNLREALLGSLGDVDGQDSEENNLDDVDDPTVEGEDALVDEGEDTEDGEGEETEEDSGEDTDGKKSDEFEIEVNGEKVTVSLDELKQGYMRTADYTRKTQALKTTERELQTLTSKVQEYEQQLDQTEALTYQLGNDFGTTTGDILGAISADERGVIDPRIVIEEISKFLESASLLHPQVAQRLGYTPEQVEAARSRVAQRQNLLNRGAQIHESERKTERKAAVSQDDEWATSVTNTTKLAVEAAGLSKEDKVAVATELSEFITSNQVKDLNTIALMAKLITDKVAAKAAPAPSKPRKKATPVNKPSAAKSGGARKPSGNMKEDLLKLYTQP